MHPLILLLVAEEAKHTEREPTAGWGLHSPFTWWTMVTICWANSSEGLRWDWADCMCWKMERNSCSFLLLWTRSRQSLRSWANKPLGLGKKHREAQCNKIYRKSKHLKAKKAMLFSPKSFKLIYKVAFCFPPTFKVTSMDHKDRKRHSKSPFFSLGVLNRNKWAGWSTEPQWLFLESLRF